MRAQNTTRDIANFVFDLLHSFAGCRRIVMRHGFMVCLKDRLIC
jgi:hypothetical protein